MTFLLFFICITVQKTSHMVVLIIASIPYANWYNHIPFRFLIFPEMQYVYTLCLLRGSNSNRTIIFATFSFLILKIP